MHYGQGLALGSQDVNGSLAGGLIELSATANARHFVWVEAAGLGC